VIIDMIFLLIAIGWIAIALLCWGACALAARGDGRETGKPIGARQKKTQNREGLVVWETLPELRVNVKDTTPIAH
jgi:hypothetical protein